MIDSSRLFFGEKSVPSKMQNNNKKVVKTERLRGCILQYTKSWSRCIFAEEVEQKQNN
jgi:hypothetical protein